MGLDAHVSCNCYELGKLREPPPVDPQYIKVDPREYLICDAPEWKTIQGGHGTFTSQLYDFDNWRSGDRGCEHESDNLVHHRLGNAGGMGALRAELSREADKFRILLERVIYSGTHSGDYLTLDLVERLIPELEELAHFDCKDPVVATYIGEFQQQMVELVQASLSVGKPIWF